MKTWKFLLLGSAGLALAATGVALLAAERAAACRLRADVARLFAESADVAGQVHHEARLVGLPAPVKRYFRHVLRDGQPYLRGLRLRHNGQFKTEIDKDWVAIEGEEYMRASPAGFIWQGATSLFTARDEYTDGHGCLSVRLLGAVPLLRGEGPAYDQGELLRWLGESAWMPTALLPGPELAWVDVDDHSARLLCRHDGQEAAYLVRFNEYDEIAECEALRHRGDGPPEPWLGRFSAYRDWHGVCVPTVLEASWVVGGRRRPYARFVVQDLDYTVLKPY
ncbi:hypothetical protein MUN81_14795 [Hymenobacter sp. 5317J-9]|uniref:DUF6544 family protein n=1 Tax=Hymenobacter sp. 5317J-9 TaxID=2932250 RepID=UPI001FD6A115|nr:DUF6544 family protein [Hymenobacter sp. 5317J-9]UOQ96505.1 hypothetical protein MUN81_14795 [Hymenobacter sp. 5317J-9]